MNTFYHIVEHYPPGTIYNLINGLTIYKNHNVLLIKNYDDFMKQISEVTFDKNSIIVLHCTGRLLPVFTKLDMLFPTVEKKYIYMHVSYNYLIYKKRFKAIELLKQYDKIGIKILCPSNPVKKQYIDNGLKAITIRPGISIKKSCFQNSDSNLKKYYGKIISCCTEDTLDYQHIKGINELTKIINKNNLENMTLYVGTNVKIDKIECKKFSNSDFLQILKHAKVYIQLSKFESYNITAVEAKQLKIPIILSNTEGHLESGGIGIIVQNNNDAEKELLKIVNNDNKELNNIVNKNYDKSILYESIESFYKEFCRIEKSQ